MRLMSLRSLYKHHPLSRPTLSTVIHCRPGNPSLSTTSSSADMSEKFRLFVTRREEEIPRETLELLKQQKDLSVTFSQESGAISPQNLLRNVSEIDALFCLLTDKVSRNVVGKAKKLKVIGSMAVGYDHLDLESIREKGIKVGYTPDVLTDATAELTLALLLATSRRLLEGSQSLRSGQWGTWSPLYMCGRTLKGSTVGIVGLGRIGQGVQKRLVPFGVKTFLYSGRRRKSIEEENGAEYVDFPTLLSSSDYVVATTSLTPETRDLFDEKAFATMKNSAVFVNTSRGGLVNQEALINALTTGQISAAGLDVMTPEPLPVDHPLTKVPNCVLIPHLGSATIETRTEMATLTVKNILAGLRGEEMPAKLV